MTLLQQYNSDLPGFKASRFCYKGSSWSARYLYEQVQELGLKPEKVKLAHIDRLSMPWEGGSISDIHAFIKHMVRVQAADTSIPIIIGNHGYIMDGWHRVCKAILEGKTFIKAYRFTSNIEPDGDE